MRALRDDTLVQAAREENGRLIRDRADYHSNMLALSRDTRYL